MEMTAEQIRNDLASEEFWPDIDGDTTSDSAWHYWLQPKYDQEQRKKWLDQHRGQHETHRALDTRRTNTLIDSIAVGN
jgi:hypothetical protein